MAGRPNGRRAGRRVVKPHRHHTSPDDFPMTHDDEATRQMLRTPPGALLLTPGAGADRNQRTLVALEAAVSPLPCRRVDFPYRLQGKRVPDKAPVAVAHLMQQAAELTTEAGVAADRLVLGGRSYGGRMCSMA